MRREMFCELNGKAVIVTGANGQVGRVLSLKLHEVGVKVIGLDIVESSENCFFEFLKVDVSDEEAVKRVFDSKVLQDLEPYGLVNNAGYSIFPDFNLRSKEDFFRTLEVNLWAPFLLTREFSRLNEKVESPSGWRSIVNVSSIYGIVSPDFRIYDTTDRRSSEIYGSSKSGLLQMTRYFSVALADKRIRVNSVVPGGVFNDTNPQSDQFVQKYSHRVPMRRMAKTEEIVSPIIFLLSDSSSYITGATLVIDGGLSAM